MILAKISYVSQIKNIFSKNSKTIKNVGKCNNIMIRADLDRRDPSVKKLNQ